jgi:hypothetical protein
LARGKESAMKRRLFVASASFWILSLGDPCAGRLGERHEPRTRLETGTQSDQKSFIDGNRFLAPVDFPLGYINPRISANALAEPHLAGFERLKAFSTFS